MNAIQLPFLVEGILILTGMAFGVLLGRSGRPYGKVKLGIHLFIFLWFSTGFAFIIYSLSRISVSPVTWSAVALIGLAILTQVVTGIVMLASGKAGKLMPKIHVTSAVLMIVADICAFFITGNYS